MQLFWRWTKPRSIPTSEFLRWPNNNVSRTLKLSRGVSSGSVKSLSQGKLLLIEGNIAAGKSILSRRLGDILNYKVYDEPAPKNPYLAKFYKDPLKYSLKLQLWLFQQRFEMYLDALHHIKDTGHGAILDRSIYSDLVFTNVICNDGNMSNEGYEYYLKVRQKALEGLIAPCAIIYLDVPAAVCFQRIVKRGRDYEQQIPLAYLEKLNAEHERVFNTLCAAQACPILSYDWSEFGFDERLETRDLNSNGSSQYHVSGINKIIKDIESMDCSSWYPHIPDRFQESSRKPDLIESELKVNGYDHRVEQISQE